ncbi:MAG: AbrB/MazE/SpoVT family DNA-binding domain-containing protein [Methylococcales bacterium]|jgi:AbrB family looped-hinge helix DNA binding protein|nr:AbrB/MazE/SpoVT family DNA-binding domain-containing protein [Methylococcales bacterium]
MISAKLSSKYQLSIPKSIRESLKLKAGQQFTLITIGKIIEMVPIISVENARGMLGQCDEYNSDDYRDRKERDL